MDHSHRLTSCDTSLVVSGGVDCGKGRRNIYDKKSQRHAKDNIKAHLTAHSDKSVAYITNNKRLLGLFATAELLMETSVSEMIRKQPLVKAQTALKTKK